MGGEFPESLAVRSSLALLIVAGDLPDERRVQINLSL